MPSSVAHGLAAVAVCLSTRPAERPRFYAAAALGTVLLDVDAIGRPFGLGDIEWLGGHRALTHGLPFAAALALGTLAVVARGANSAGHRLGVWTSLFCAYALHGVLDAATTYGDGVMFLAPFWTWRYKAAWQPFHGVLPEVVGVWVPSLAVIWYGARRRADAIRPARA